jgi:hypothetical protein
MFLVILAYFILLLEDLSKFSKYIHFLVRPQQILANLLKFDNFRKYSKFYYFPKNLIILAKIHDIFF